MNALTDRFEDGLEPLGVGVGAFLVLAALGILVGAPWNTNPDTLAVAIKLLGTVGMAAVGAGLAFLAWTGRE